MAVTRPRDSARERLTTTAFRLFAAQGFDATTVDDIADAAGVSRRTFFRHFATKEDVIFPDHDGLRAAVEAQLDARDNEPPLRALCNSVRVVLAHYVNEAEVALARYALTRQVPSLREREVNSVHSYQTLFVRYLRSRLPELDELRLQLMAAAVVTGHNASLRAWLRSNGRKDAYQEFEQAAHTVQELFAPAAQAHDAVIAVFHAQAPLPQVVRAVEAAVRDTTGVAPRGRRQSAK